MDYLKYQKEEFGDTWVVYEKGHNWRHPQKAITFAFDTETLVYFKGKILDQTTLFKRIQKLKTDKIRSSVHNVVWAWQIYDEVNGFFMTNDFNTFLQYQCLARMKFGWCYNATFDFAQIDYQILGVGADKWRPHVHDRTTKGQAWTYESLHSDTGSRYAYKLWIPHKNASGHNRVHAVDYRDFMKLCAGGLKRVLNDLDITDNEGNKIRKLEMDYQAVDQRNLTEEEIDYCCNDVKGLYFAVKKFNQVIEAQSDGELHIFGQGTNVMTAGGYAKACMLKSLYPSTKPKFRIQRYQRQHPITAKEDRYFRDNKLYRGGISFVNPKYQGLLIKDRLMYRYDVNSEYPYCMAELNDLVGRPFIIKYTDWVKMDKDTKAKYECIYILKSLTMEVKKGMLGIWYNPFKKAYCDYVDETETHLVFEEELNEVANWYEDIVFDIDEVILIRKGQKVYKDFVERNYKLKAQAKREGNKSLQQATKLTLNSSYGKLAERTERVKGHFAVSEETGAIHFVVDGVDQSIKSIMNVIVGAKITSMARVYILSKIREICYPNVEDNFIYIDTDSIHCFKPYDKADAYALGGLKLEATCEACKYVLPKTYVDILKVNKDGTIDYKDIEIHTKGVNLLAVYSELMKKQKGKKKGKPTLELIDRKIDYGVAYRVLVAMNVVGGKVLLPQEKFLAKIELAPNRSKVLWTNMAGQGFLQEI